MNKLVITGRLNLEGLRPSYVAQATGLPFFSSQCPSGPCEGSYPRLDLAEVWSRQCLDGGERLVAFEVVGVSQTTAGRYPVFGHWMAIGERFLVCKDGDFFYSLSWLLAHRKFGFGEFKRIVRENS